MSITPLKVFTFYFIIFFTVLNHGWCNLAFFNKKNAKNTVVFDQDTDKSIGSS